MLTMLRAQGVMAQYRTYLPPTTPMGCALAIVSDVPLGGGLSSSASLEVAVATLLEAMFHHDLVGSRSRRAQARTAASPALHELDGVGRALRCQRAEHEFAHMPCAWASCERHGRRVGAPCMPSYVARFSLT